MRGILLKVTLIILSLASAAFSQRALVGSVSDVLDGQTIRVATTGGTILTVRLRSIEVPDEGQPFNEIVVDHLRKLALDKVVELRISQISDAFVYSKVTLNGVDLSQQLLRDGAAWYSEEDASSKELEAVDRALEQAAKIENRGIWGIAGLKRPSQLRKAIESSKNPLDDPSVAQLAWEQLGYSVEGIFRSESFTTATGDCSGTVTTIIDGDTVQIQTAAGQQVVRLAGIDAPERSQRYGMGAKQHLSHLIAGKLVSCTSTKKDRYGRLIAKLSLNGTDINLEMVRDGFAWQYKEYAEELTMEDRLRYADAERVARSGRLGLWTDSNPIYPSDYRRRSFLARYYDPYMPSSAGAAYDSDAGRVITSSGGSGPVRVRGYTRRDGTQVRPHSRSRPR